MLALVIDLSWENNQYFIFHIFVKTECQNKLPYSAHCLHRSRLLFAWTKVPNSCREPEDAGPIIAKKEV